VIGDFVKVNRCYLISISKDGSQFLKALHDTGILLSVGVEWVAREAQLTKRSSRGTDGLRWLIALMIMDWDLCSGNWE
jgi:hypothetical protein